MKFYRVRPPLCSSEVEGEKVKEVDLLSCSPVNLGRKKEEKESGKVVLVIHSLGEKKAGDSGFWFP